MVFLEVFSVEVLEFSSGSECCNMLYIMLWASIIDSIIFHINMYFTYFLVKVDVRVYNAFQYTIYMYMFIFYIALANNNLALPLYKTKLI